MRTQDLADAIREVGVRTGTDIVAPDDLVRGRAAPPLTGIFDARQALARLLEGSELTFRSTGEALVVVRRDDAGDIVVVTGSNLRGAPATSPVITLTRRDIEQAAPASVEELMRKLPQNVSAGVAQENVGVTGTGADITDQGAGVDLRGLGQRATLVLVNGQRIAPSGTGSYVDVSMIPVSALERVEVLTDGASAVYGSDAVAGVVNFILRKDFRGLDVMTQAGTSTRGGGTQFLGDATAGAGWNTGHAMLSYELRSEGDIRAGDRDFTINLPAQWSLFPKETRHSLFGVIRQDLNSHAALEVTGLFSQRRTRRSFFEGGSAVAVDGDAHARLAGGTALLSLDAGKSWRLEASASAFADRTHEKSFQHTIGLFNRFDTRNSMAEFVLRADGSLVELAGGPLKLAAGALVRREHFESLFGTAVNMPIPQAGSRTVSAVYGELNLPIFGSRNRRPGFERLVASLAARAEHYQAIGSTFNPKFGLLWSPVPGLALRSSYATSFRAPLLNETLGLYNVFLFPAAFLYIDPSSAPGGVGAALVGSNPKVKPERSRSFAAGADWNPPGVARLQLRATYYRIIFSNRIALPTDQIIVAGNPAFDPIVTRGPDPNLVGSLFAGAGQVLDFSGPGFTNGGAGPGDVSVIVDARSSNTAETRTSGLDLGASYQFATGQDRWRLDLNANRIFAFDDRLTRSSPVIHTLNTPFHPVSMRLRAGVSWIRGPWSAWTYGNFTGAYRDTRFTPSRPVDAYTTIDAGIAWSGMGDKKSALGHARVSLIAQNLLDAAPPHLLPDPGFTRGTGYDPVNATGRGRTIALQLRASW